MRGVCGMLKNDRTSGRARPARRPPARQALVAWFGTADAPPPIAHAGTARARHHHGDEATGERRAGTRGGERQRASDSVLPRGPFPDDEHLRWRKA